MTDSQCSTPPKDDKIYNLKRKYQIEKPSFIEVQKKRKQTRFNQQPRWHSQAFMLFLALRQHSEKTMPRTDLIKGAIAIDKKISEERLIPKVFRGKTPMNSASAILTNNADRYFIPFKPDGSRSMHFKLSFEPGNFEHAFHVYQTWQENLVTHDWPTYFCQTKKQTKSKNIMSIENLVDHAYPTEFDEFMANRKRERQQKIWNPSPPISPSDDLPRGWQDLLFLHPAREGVSAKRFLPKNAPLGFYFGVPMTESEFEALKETSTSEYAYQVSQSIVIDPTDDRGELYLYQNEPICPFYFIKETNLREQANVVFYEGQEPNQVVCWTKRDIYPEEELYIYLSNNNTQPKSQFYPSSSSANSIQNKNLDYWQPSLSNITTVN